MLEVSIRQNHSDFFQRVYQVVELIPEGRVTSYGLIANYLSAKRSSRMVGWAMNACHSLPHIPAHRVVNRNGFLTGKSHFNPPSLMQKILEKEGITIKNDQVVDFKKIVWDPMVELSL